MPTIKIDNQDYELDQLSAESKAQLGSIQFCDWSRAGSDANAHRRFADCKKCLSTSPKSIPA